MLQRLVLSFLVSLLLVGVAASQSLFTSDHEGLFDDHRAKYVGDSLLIMINESTSTYQKNNRNMDNASSVSMGPISSVQAFMSTNTGVGALLGGTNSIPAKDSFKASGLVESQGNFSGEISARVIKILDSGELEIEGSKQTMVNGEKQMIKVNGIVRREDINQNNTILSSYIANANIFYKNDGELQNNSEPGLLNKLFNMVF
jgi:flagellar L-ring protein FlgH